MAYFSNSSEGDILLGQCCDCIYGEDPCPIALAQSLYNYEACNIPTARKILDELVTNEDGCQLYKIIKSKK